MGMMLGRLDHYSNGPGGRTITQLQTVERIRTFFFLSRALKVFFYFLKIFIFLNFFECFTKNLLQMKLLEQ